MKTAFSLILTAVMLSAGQAYAEQGRNQNNPGAKQRHHQQFREHRPHDPGVNRRQHVQDHRIKEGVRSGQLTREEFQGIREDRREIRMQEREYKSDGRLTKEERKDLHQDLNTLSKEIYEEKHDDEMRPKARRK